MNIVLGFVFLLCLLLLIMIFGEQLSVFGAFHGRWISAVSELLADAWDAACDAVESGWSFVLEHLWWVLAVGSGCSGALIVAWMVFAGVVNNVAAEAAERSGLLNAGGVLDTVPEISGQLQDTPVTLASYTSTNGRSLQTHARRTWQVPSPYLKRVLPEFEPEPEREEIAEGSFPPLPDFSRRWRREPSDFNYRDWDLSGDESRNPQVLRPEKRFRERRASQQFSDLVEEVDEFDDDRRITSVTGRTEVAGMLKREIEFALRQLEFEGTEWRRSYARDNQFPDFINPASAEQEIPEATEGELRAMESRVRVLPGQDVSESDLRVEKLVRPLGSGGEFEIEIRITNRSARRQMSGLVVRERLPRQAQPVALQDGGIYRRSTITWVIEQLPPLESRTLFAHIRAASGRRLASRTEVSAVAAVTSEVSVAGEQRRRPERTRPEPLRPERPRPEQPRPEPQRTRPDVRLTIGDLPRTVALRDKIAIPFQLHNAGTGTAREIELRVELPTGLDHFHLDDEDVHRDVTVTVRNLEAGATKTVILRVRAEETGEQRAIVELLENRRQKDFTSFRVDVGPADDSSDDDTLPPLLPEPDGGINAGRI